MIITNNANLFGEAGVGIDMGELLDDVPKCRLCGSTPYLFQGFKHKTAFLVTNFGVKLPAGKRLHYAYFCSADCENMCGPAPTIDLLDQIWRMENE